MSNLIDEIDLSKIFSDMEISPITNNMSEENPVMIFNSKDDYCNHLAKIGLNGFSFWKNNNKPKIYIKEIELKTDGIIAYSEIAYGGILVELYDKDGSIKISCTGKDEVIFENFVVVRNGYYLDCDGLTYYRRVTKSKVNSIALITMITKWK